MAADLHHGAVARLRIAISMSASQGRGAIGLDINDHRLIWDRLDKVHAKLPGQQLNCPTMQPQSRATGQTVAVQGSIAVRPAAVKAPVLRDATAKSCAAAIAAI